jgi:hypothetical protein
MGFQLRGSVGDNVQADNPLLRELEKLRAIRQLDRPSATTGYCSAFEVRLDTETCPFLSFAMTRHKFAPIKKVALKVYLLCLKSRLKKNYLLLSRLFGIVVPQRCVLCATVGGDVCRRWWRCVPPLVAK